MSDRTLDAPGAWRLDTYLVDPRPVGTGLPGSRPSNRERLVLRGAEAHHAVDVVRVRTGDHVRLIDGEGLEAIARVERAGSGEAELSVVDARVHSREARVELTVAQALLKGRSFDEVVRRCSELGAAEIIPVATERAVSRPGPGGTAPRHARWEAIALAAVKQSRGVFLPRIRGAVDLETVGRMVAGHDLSLVAWEEETGNSLKEALEATVPRKLLLVVGPEGGLARAEVSLLVESGARPVSVGRRVLKADWAAAAIAAMISQETGGLLP